MAVSHFVHDAELVPAAQVSQEVDFAAEDFSHLRGDAIGNVSVIGGCEQGCADGTDRYARFGVGDFLDLARLESLQSRCDFQVAGGNWALAVAAWRVEIA